MASERYTRLEDVVLAANRADESNEKKESKRPARSATNFDERPMKKQIYQPYHPQGGGPQPLQNPTFNMNYQKPHVQTSKNLNFFKITK